MLGHYGEVVVADWGIARPFHQGDSTQSTKVFGTPAHIAPEQLRQEFAAGDFKTDVYSLGSCLYEILTLAPPRSGSWIEVISLVRSTKITAPRKAGSPFDLPEGLDEVCMRALSADRDHRFESAEEFAREIEAILDRSRDRKLRAKRASELVARAQEMGNNSNKEKARAQKLIADARRYLSNVQPWQSENDKEEGWALEDAAEEIRLARQRTSVEVEQVLRAALTHDPNHSSTHRALANHYRDIHNRAELSQDRAEAIRAEALMRFHTDSLKTGDPEKARHKRYLAGRGYISLRTEPDNARITICRYETRKRRLVAAKIDDNIHPAPLDNFWLPIGTYLAQIECDGFHNTIYPFTIGRDQKWRPKRPGSDQPTLIRLLEEGQVKPEEAYIPAGWFQCGGDPQASGTLPQRQVWIDDFVIQKFPVTNREYLIFLNDLAQSNREAEALQYAPRQRPGKAGGQGPLIYSYEDQTFGLQEDADGHLLRPEWPVVMVDWYGACGYADWFSDRTSQPYRLPTELEWEKAARGVDGRFHPWGDFLDPSWCCIRDSHPEDPKPCDVESFPVDVSVYGVRGMAGNSRDWCLSAYREEGPLLEEGIAKTDSLRERNEDQTTPRIFRGGCCYYFAQFSRCATRVWYSPFFRFGSLGFRLARSIAPDE
jgi:serine/threonine-protein kinase